MMKERFDKVQKKYILYLWTFILTLIVMGGICLLLHVVPFGNNTFATRDADIQYLDFFAYLKDVLAGEQSIAYTFGKTLGGNNIAVFGYYLSSPFNLLLIFFKKSQLEVFYTVVVTLKISLAAVACAFFLRNRFESLKNIYVIVLSLSYALMQYNMFQICNAMWLDGVYMLPFILLAVHRLVKEKRSVPLIIAVGLAVIFNWYSGAIDCLYSAIWFVYEVLDQVVFSKENRKLIGMLVWKYFYTMLLGVCFSAVLFLPVVFAMLGGRAGVDISSLKEHYYWGNYLSCIQKLVIGSYSDYAAVSLYCGSVPLLGTLAYFFRCPQEKKKKVMYAALLFVTVSTFYVPLFIFVFGLLKDVGSYWYRYSYIGVFPLIVIAAEYFSDKDVGKRKKEVFHSVIAVAVVLLVFEYFKPVNEMVRVYFTIAAFAVSAILILNEEKKICNKLLIIMVMGELACNAKVMNNVVDHAESYQTYVNAEEKLIDEVREQNDGFYRINQTSTRNEESNNLTANYNESIAFGYNSISGYTSDPDDIQREFLNRLGYNICGDNMNIVDTSILGADSLLNVEYVLSDYSINGLVKVDGIQEKNGKSVYYNPYVLPFAFQYTNGEQSVDETESNPFLYQNQIYSQLIGESVSIYKPLNYETMIDGNSVEFQISLPQGKFAMYGYCDISEWGSGDIYVDDEYICGYSQWLAPRVIYVPDNGNGQSVAVRIDKENIVDCMADVQFYYLDLEEFQRVVDKIKTQSADQIEIANGQIDCTVTTKEKNQNLMLSMPYEDGWKILQNGQEVKPQKVGDCLISIPLSEGKNVIEMSYHARGIWAGRILTGISLLAIAFLEVVERKKSSK